MTLAEKARRRAKYAQVLDRRNAVWGLRVKGYTQARIGQEVGVAQSTVSRDLKWASERALSDLVEYVTQTKIEQVFRLYHIAGEAMLEWERSKKKRVASQVKETHYALGAGVEAESGEKALSQTVTTVGEVERLGQVKYLDVVMRALADVRAILGANAPLLHAMDVTTLGQPIKITEVVVEIPSTVVDADYVISGEGGEG